MFVAIWIIAVCEVIRAVQNHIQLTAIRNSNANSMKNMDAATQEFVKRLKQTDREFIQSVMIELDKMEEKKENEQSNDSSSEDY